MLWTYRRNNPGLNWSDLTGEWPQPIWRTNQDLWYSGIYGEYLESKQTSRSPTAHNDATEDEIAAYKQRLIDEMLSKQAPEPF